MYSLEEKWIKNEISRETYDRWYFCYYDTVTNLQGSVERLGGDQYNAFNILSKQLNLLPDMRYAICIYQVRYFGQEGIREPGVRQQFVLSGRHLSNTCHYAYVYS